MVATQGAGGGHAGADSSVKMMPNEAELPCPQGHGHPLGCRHLHLLEDARQRDRGHHLGGSSSVWRCSRRGLACSSSSSSRDESFCTCLEHAWGAMKLCSFMRTGELLAQQPVLSGAVVFGVCVCCCVSTSVVQTCAVTLRGSVGSTRRVIHPPYNDVYARARAHKSTSSQHCDCDHVCAGAAQLLVVHAQLLVGMPIRVFSL